MITIEKINKKWYIVESTVYNKKIPLLARVFGKYRYDENTEKKYDQIIVNQSYMKIYKGVVYCFLAIIIIKTETKDPKLTAKGLKFCGNCEYHIEPNRCYSPDAIMLVGKYKGQYTKMSKEDLSSLRKYNNCFAFEEKEEGLI